MVAGLTTGFIQCLRRTLKPGFFDQARHILHLGMLNQPGMSQALRGRVACCSQLSFCMAAGSLVNLLFVDGILKDGFVNAQILPVFGGGVMLGIFTSSGDHLL